MRKIQAFNNYDTFSIRTFLRIESIFSFYGIIIWLMIFTLIVGVALFSAKDSAYNVMHRVLFFTPFLLIFLIVRFFKPILLILDLLFRKKIVISSSDYECLKTKEKEYLILKDQNNFKLKINSNTLEEIEKNEPIILEFAKISKTLLLVAKR